MLKRKHTNLVIVYDDYTSSYKIKFFYSILATEAFPSITDD